MGKPDVKNDDTKNIDEIDVLWVTAGLGCDGDTIAMTAATQPSIEEIVLGGIPWIPKVNFHNPFLAMANGDDFLRPFHQAAEGKLGPFILVVEGSIPDETNKKEGYWASMGTDPVHRAADYDLRVDRSPRSARMGGRGGRDLRHLWRHSRHAGKSNRRHGSGRLPGVAVEVERQHPHRVRSGVSGPAGQHDGDAACTSFIWPPAALP